MKLARTLAKLTVNGKEYHSLDEIPEEIRKLLEDKDGDGLPDCLRSGSSLRAGFHMEMRTVNGVATYTVGGQEYQSLEEVPAEVRALFTDRDGDGLPDFLKSVMAQPGESMHDDAGRVECNRARPGARLMEACQAPRGETEPSSADGLKERGMLVGFLVLLLCAGLAIAYALGR